MKIAILTLPLHTNYGGILQCYALQTVLERMGHKVFVIEQKIKPARLPLHLMPFCYGKRILRNLIGHKFPIFYEQKYNRIQSAIRQNTDIFISRYIHIKKYKSFSDIGEDEYDAIVVGSDQVWRPIYFGASKIENAYLKFAERWNIKRVSYAASFGTNEWEYTQEQTYECGRLLKKFDAVSVREYSATLSCKQYFGVDAQQVLDPTLLLKKEDYINLCEATNIPKSKGNLLCCILDETDEKKELVRHIADEKGLTPFNVTAKIYDENAPLNERIQPPLEQWLRGFCDADVVVTDSFHACVFSIIFQKQFIVLGNKQRGLDRFSSWLTFLSLEERMINSFYDNNIWRLVLSKNINYTDIKQKLDAERLRSLAFLNKNIGDIK